MVLLANMFANTAMGEILIPTANDSHKAISQQILFFFSFSISFSFSSAYELLLKTCLRQKRKEKSCLHPNFCLCSAFIKKRKKCQDSSWKRANIFYRKLRSVILHPKVKQPLVKFAILCFKQNRF